MSVCQSSTTLAMLCEVNSAEHQTECEGVKVGIQLAGELGAELSSSDSTMCFKSEDLPY